jgi:hypothetical protein
MHTPFRVTPRGGLIYLNDVAQIDLQLQRIPVVDRELESLISFVDPKR